MAEFQRKQNPFLHKGMNWNIPTEKPPSGQWNWCKNVRVLEQGTVSSAHGFTSVFQFPSFTNYVHSMSRLNLLNPQFTTQPGQPLPELAVTYVYGVDRQLYTFQDQTTLSNSALNPLITPNNRNADGSLNASPQFSGNPLSIVDAQPSGAAVAWKYIGDSKQMVTVGYYATDQQGVNMARCLTIGLAPPIINFDQQPTAMTPASPQLLGSYQWCFAYRRLDTGARSNPSGATRVNVTNPAMTFTTAGGASIPIPTAPLDPQTGLPDQRVVVDIYRFGGNITRWALVGTSQPGGGDTFVDNTNDENLLAAPAPPQVTDSATGLTRFNLFQPFVTQDVAHSGLGTITGDDNPAVNGRYYITLDATAPDLFKTGWVPGSNIYLGLPGHSQIACTIYQVISPTIIEISEDITSQIAAGLLNYGTDGTSWSINAGTLTAGQPLSHLWGPYGLGQSGMYLFACGDPNNPGTLYWTNGNDPDSTDVVNSIVVASPSERLMTGAVYDGQPYTWSTERQFVIYPSLTIFGQFTTQEIAGAKGCWMEWSLSVQSNGFTDQSVTWRGKDGIYNFSTSGLVRLSNDLYAFFPHDGNPGLAPETILPMINQFSQEPEHVGNLDDTQPQYHRTAWFHGLLFYDFVAQSQVVPGGVSTFSTLVYDAINIPGGGWVSLDQPFSTTLKPVARGIDVGANVFPIDAEPAPSGAPGPMDRGGNLKVSWGNTVYDYYGYTRGFQSRIITPAEDLGDSRAMKRWGDFWFDGTPLPSFSVYPLVNFNLTTLQPLTAQGDAAANYPRQQYVLDFVETSAPASLGQGLLGPTLGLDIRWVTLDGGYAATINQWSPSFVPKPELIEFRATDPSDQGSPQAKYLMGCNIEADTRAFVDPTTGLPIPIPTTTQTVPLNVIIDNELVATINLSHSGQQTKPYAWKPVAGYEFQVQFQFESASTIVWQLFKVSWIFEPWPDAVVRTYPFQDLGNPGAKFIQGVVMPIETNGETATIGLFGDDDNTLRTWQKSTQPLIKTGTVFDLSEPFVAHEIQWSTLTPHRIWPTEAKVVWEPIPELTETWQTQPGDWGFCTWWHVREAYIGYMGGSGTPTLEITDEYETVQYALDPVTSNQYIRCYRALRPMKSKWKSFRISNAGGVRVYQNDTCIFAKEWGSTGPFISLHPFGGGTTNPGAQI